MAENHCHAKPADTRLRGRRSVNRLGHVDRRASGTTARAGNRFSGLKAFCSNRRVRSSFRCPWVWAAIYYAAPFFAPELRRKPHKMRPRHLLSNVYSGPRSISRLGKLLLDKRAEPHRKSGTERLRRLICRGWSRSPVGPPPFAVPIERAGDHIPIVGRSSSWWSRT